MAVDVLANDTDPDGDALAVTAVGRAGTGTTALSAGTVRYTPRRDWAGTDTFTYTVSDGRGGTATGRVTVTVTRPANTAPVAAGDTVSTTQGKAVSVPVLGNDSDADRDRLSLVSLTRARHGSLSASRSGTVVYRPQRGFVGTDTFTYTVSDGRGGTATATVTVTVTASATRARG